MGAAINVGDRFGRLTVYLLGEHGCALRCDCGANRWAHHSALRSGRARSCGKLSCLARPRARSPWPPTPEGVEPGQRFGRLLVLEAAEPYHGARRWLCRCDCGELTSPTDYVLRHGIASSCGGVGCKEWVQRNPRVVKFNHVGHTYGKLTVLAQHEPGSGLIRWLCRCECGRTTIARSGPLAYGQKRSCGERACRRGLPKQQRRQPQTTRQEQAA